MGWRCKHVLSVLPRRAESAVRALFRSQCDGSPFAEDLPDVPNGEVKWYSIRKDCELVSSVTGVLDTLEVVFFVDVTDDDNFDEFTLRGQRGSVTRLPFRSREVLD